MKRPRNSMSFKKILVTGAALLLAVLVAPAQAEQQQPQWRSGADLYNNVCGHCHKPEVGVGTVLQGRELPVEYLKVIVRHGFNAMPAFPASYVDDAALAELSKYLASLPPLPPKPVPPPAKAQPGASP
jgi:mono/diheme cytochrome c family protein